MTDETLISFKNVTYRYANAERDAVEGISLEVRAGEAKVVTGASGCGKTTLMRLANGLCPQVYGGTLSGEIRVAGLDVAQTPVSDLSEVIGTLFQDPEEQFFALSVGDEIAFALRSRGYPVEKIRSRVDAAARKLGITQLLGQDIHALSEGQKQKVGLAGLLALGPRVLIFDEPSANLDPEATDSLALTITELKKEGCAILVVDHRLYWLKDAADGVIVMSRGRVMEKGPFAMLADAAFRAKYGLRSDAVADARQTLPAVPVISPADPIPEDAVFACRNVDFAYSPQKTIFKGAGFAVKKGITALIGDNGTGKTTMARILTGLNKASGEFFVASGQVPAAGLMKHAGLVLQNADHQLQMRTVFDEVSAALQAGRLGKSGKKGFLAALVSLRLTEEDREKVRGILAGLNLSHLADRHPQSLSGGEKQRVVIACAVAKDPDILILDEPTSGLDGANMASIAGLLKAQAALGRAVFLITHDLELLAVCDAALRMKDLQAPSAEAPGAA